MADAVEDPVGRLRCPGSSWRGSASASAAPADGGRPSRSSSEPAVDVVGGARVGRVLEDARSVGPLSTMPPGVPCSARKNAPAAETRAACCMLWVTMTIVTSVPQLGDGLLDPAGRGRVERRARLVHQQDLGPDGQRPGDAQPLLLAAGQRAARPVEPVLDLVPQPGLRQAVLDQLVAVGSADLGAGQLRPAVTLSAIDMAGNGFGFWKTMPIRLRVSVTRWPAA